MKDLKEDINKYIESKSKEIFDLLIKMYEENVEVNKPFCQVVFDNVPLDYKFCEVDILHKIIKLIPQYLCVCPNHKYVFVKRQMYDNYLPDNDLKLDINKILSNIDITSDDMIKEINKNLTKEELESISCEQYFSIIDKIKED